jgi:apolipoprotein N-acyltransferase
VTALLHPLLQAAASGLLLWLAFPGGGAMPALLAVALAPLFATLRLGTPRMAALAGLSAGLVHHLLLLYWITIVLSTYGGLPWFLSGPALLLLALYMSLYWALFALGARLALDTLPPWACLWLLPALWVGLDWLRSLLFSGFPWMDLGYALAGQPLLIQTADLVGHYGLTYVIVLVNLLVVLLLRHRRHRPTLAALILPACLLLLCAGLYTRQRLAEVKTLTEEAPRITLGVVQGNIDQAVKWSPQQLQKTVDSHLQLSEKLAADPAPQLLVWPETALPHYPLDEMLMRRLETLLLRHQVALLSGVPWLEMSARPTGKPPLYNSALLLDRRGKVAGLYHKSHLVPFGEYVPLQELLPFIAPLVQAVGDFSAGTIESPLPLGDARLGVLICFESVFPELSRRWVAAGANLLVNLTNDAWYGRSSAPQHSLAMAVLRAVETRRSLVRSANTGISAYIEPSGAISARSEIFVPWAEKRGVALLDEKTVWMRFGHLFAPLSLAAGFFAVALASTLRRRRKE